MRHETAINKAKLLANMQQGWTDFEAYLQAIGEGQLAGPTDAAGWTAKDHLAHLAVWEAGLAQRLNGGGQRESMGIDAETWAGQNIDQINAIIQQAHQSQPLADVFTDLRSAHNALYLAVQSLSDEELRQPFNYYGPPQDRPLSDWIIGDSYGHYAEHIPWIDAIVKS